MANRQEFYGEFASTVNTLTAFIDPKRTRFTLANVASVEWDRLSNQMHSVLEGKVASFLRDDVRFNRESTLAKRRSMILSQAEKLKTQSLSMNATLANRMSRIEQMVAALPAPGKPVRMALTMDAKGDVISAGVIPTYV
ncbi:hypothetical protein D3C85_1118930 [compost metagenome]